MNLEKAFDSVDQNSLLSKLINCGLYGQMLATIKSFLSNRKEVKEVGSHRWVLLQGGGQE